MSDLYESDQYVLVRKFSHDVLEVASPDESQDSRQLRADLLEDVRKRSEETRAKVKAIEDRFTATESVTSLFLIIPLLLLFFQGRNIGILLSSFAHIDQSY